MLPFVHHHVVPTDDGGKAYALEMLFGLTFPSVLLTREALKSLLSGLEDWLYSEEADDAELVELKEKRRQASAVRITTAAPTVRHDCCPFHRFGDASSGYRIIFVPRYIHRS